jgi:hypothetical protein
MSKPATAQSRDNWKLLPQRVLIGALALDALLVVAYVFTVGIKRSSPLRPLYNVFGLNGEGNIPAWYSGSQLLVFGLVCLVLASWIFASDDRIAPLRRLFVTVGLAAVYLSADEVGQVHERMSTIVQSWHALTTLELNLLAVVGIHRKEIHGGSVWIPLFAVFGIILLVWLWPQLKKAWALWRREFLLLGLGFGVLVFGATVVEVIGILTRSTFSTAIEVGIEEMLEILGVSVMLYAAVRVLADAGGRLLPLSVTAPQSAPIEAQPEASPAE